MIRSGLPCILVLLLLPPIAGAQSLPPMQPVFSSQQHDVAGTLAARGDVQAFIEEMIQRHGFDRGWLQQIFTRGRIQPGIIATMTRPAESRPWHAYRGIFLTERRIAGGVDFWRAHRDTLSRAEARFGVPAEIIVAILGVETSYGENTGSHRVLEALATLAFDYPRRADFFRRELEHFLLLVREEAVDPLGMTGSYAGAMGLAQFMPSSYRAYAVDFSGDGRRDLWRNPVDAIGSIANYLAEHRWQPGGPVTVPARVNGSAWRALLSPYNDLRPRLEYRQLAAQGVHSSAPVAADAPALLLELEAEQGPEYWVGFHNFYVITRYNRSPLYAMAVHQLGREIRARMGGT